MQRRQFITLLGGATTTWPVAAWGQQPAIPVIGMLSSESPDLQTDRMRAFRQGLSDAGYVEGRNVAIDYRWAHGNNDQLPSLAADLVARRVTVIATPGSTLGALAAKAATTTIPIVFVTGADPIVAGLVPSLNRPGGHVTGVTTLNVEVAPKRLELLHELVPTATIIALLVNPTNPALAQPTTRDVQAAAYGLGLPLHVLHAASEEDLETAFASFVKLRAGALVIGTDQFFNSRVEQLAALTVRHAVPAIYAIREFVVAGGLMSYGSHLQDAYYLGGRYTGRILKGEKAADLPVQQATRVELIINIKTAKALGITFPISLLGRADEVIE
jgi:putative ABC transport system substrate-binding protein